MNLKWNSYFVVDRIWPAKSYLKHLRLRIYVVLENLQWISIQESHRNLKMGFKDELSVASEVSRHCTSWALSDPKVFWKLWIPTWQFLCTSNLDSMILKSSHCEMRAVALDENKQLVEKLFPGDSFEDREMRFDMEENINSIRVSKVVFFLSKIWSIYRSGKNTSYKISIQIWRRRRYSKSWRIESLPT